jgi:hypothetical protein
MPTLRSTAASESRKPVERVPRGGDCLRLHHRNHGIDVRDLEPEFLLAVDLPIW